MAGLTLSELNIYPVKSCRGIRVHQAVLVDRGLQYDRRWMIADASGRFLTQRECPRLALIEVGLEANHLVLHAAGMSEQRIPLELSGNTIRQVDIWKDTVGALGADSEANAWVSSFLGIPCQLVYMPDSTFRPVNPDYAVHEDQVSFADAFPLLLISMASLHDLNRRLEVPVPMNRFRPNIVISGCGPYEEDSWKRIQIGSALFHIVKPCSRCATVTVDQKTGIRGDEPLRTLSQYRNHDGKVHFGQNVIHGNKGIVRVGDTVALLA